jgi:hypothetical protein
MSKLLTEPRGKMEISLPKKKKRIVKKASDEPVEVRYQVLMEGDKCKVDELFRIYKDNPFNARVKYFNANSKVYFSRLVVFEKGKNDFEICDFTNSFGISVTNRIYSGQKKNSSIVYKGGKFWYINRRGKGSSIRPLTWGALLNFIQEVENIHIWGKMDKVKKDSKVFQYLYAKFPWIKMLNEHKYSMGVNMNVVKANKLFGYKDITRHVMKVPNNIAEMVLESDLLTRLNYNTTSQKAWVEMLKVLDNIQSLNKELLTDHLFVDTCRMAKTLGRKVNCKWTVKRLKDEHDTWAMEIGNIVLDCEEEYEMSIRPEFIAFAEFSGYKLFRTNKALLIEGMTQNHCVGTYIDKVNRGECAIYNVGGYTLQVGVATEKETLRGFFDEEEELNDNDEIAIRIPQTKHVDVKVFKNMQFRGKYNVDAPKDLVDKVQLEFDKFKAAGKFNDIPEGYKPLDRESSDLVYQLGNNNAILF